MSEFREPTVESKIAKAPTATRILTFSSVGFSLLNRSNRRCRKRIVSPIAPSNPSISTGSPGIGEEENFFEKLL